MLNRRKKKKEEKKRKEKDEELTEESARDKKPTKLHVRDVCVFDVWFCLREGGEVDD